MCTSQLVIGKMNLPGGKCTGQVGCVLVKWDMYWSSGICTGPGGIWTMGDTELKLYKMPAGLYIIQGSSRNTSQCEGGMDSGHKSLSIHLAYITT